MSPSSDLLPLRRFLQFLPCTRSRAHIFASNSVSNYNASVQALNEQLFPALHPSFLNLLFQIPFISRISVR
jgi:hypothetical protein